MSEVASLAPWERQWLTLQQEYNQLEGQRKELRKRQNAILRECRKLMRQQGLFIVPDYLLDEGAKLHNEQG